MNVGMQLREAREARGLSLDSLASATRIKVRILEGLERNDLSAAPPRPYTRGFVAAYAREVGLDADQIARSYFAQFEQVPEPVPAPSPLLVAEPPLRGRLWVPLVAVVLVAAAAALMISRQTGETVRPVRDVVGTSGTGEAPAAPAGRPAQRSGVVPVSTQRAAAAVATHPLIVTLQVERRAWVAATADGTRVVYRVLQPGAVETLRANRDIILRVGDAGAVRWSVNGGPAAPMGGWGEVRNVRLTADSAPR